MEYSFEKIAQEAFEDEIEKIAMSSGTMARATKKLMSEGIEGFKPKDNMERAQKVMAKGVSSFTGLMSRLMPTSQLKRDYYNVLREHVTR